MKKPTMGAIDYLGTYTAIAERKLAYHTFMDLINKVYEYGYNKGQVDAIEQCKKVVNLNLDKINGTTS